MFGPREASPAVRRRILVGSALALLTFGLLAARLWDLQVLQGEHLATLSENNRLRLVRIPATRGRVVDRFHRIVIDSRASFDAVLVPEDTPDLETTVETLAHFLGQSSADTLALLERASGRPPFQDIVVRHDLDFGGVAAIETHRLELPGVSLRITPRRTYPEGPVLAHALGYVGEVSPAELEETPKGVYRQGDLIGKSGLEKVWESDLRGVNGGQQVEVDAIGRQIRVLDELEAVPGNTLVLSIDLDLQHAAEAALGEQVGAIVALDPQNGDLLAMVSRPSYDPNQFADGITAAEWRGLIEHPRRPLSARATQGQYPPGSTFKIVLAAAALEEGIINPFTRIRCGGHYRFGGRDFRCWKKGGHGSVDVHAALVQSCDVFFYQIGQRLGVDTIAQYARAFGLGEPTGVRLENEKGGTIPDSEWKRQRFSQPWYAGETLSVAIGQGYVTATPLQMAHLIGATATGVRFRPRLVRQIESPDGEPVRVFEPEEIGELPLRKTVLAQVREGLEGVVNGAGGTGKRAALPGIRVAGKTGTSQVVSLGRQRLKAHQMPWRHRDHAWFVAYAPAENPTVAVAALVEHADGGGGAVAAPMVSQVLQAFFRLQEEREPARYAQN
jgi:penicillin-binding protein 2